jgi:uridine kinase
LSSPDVASLFTPSLTNLMSLVANAGSEATIVIDGPSGAGKSTVADYLVAHWPSTAPAGEGAGVVQLVRLDDLYPGWGGLAQGADVARGILAARYRGQTASWQRYDWASAGLTTWHDVVPGAPLILEGCGALSEQAVTAAQVRLWVTVSEDVRRDRALSRGGEDFEAHWEEWDRQFNARVTAEEPTRFANMILVATE